MKALLVALGIVALMASSASAEQKARTAKSLECSKQADTQKLHGKPRKEFMKTCKKA